MTSEQPNYDELDEDELYYAVLHADWNIGTTGITSYGISLTFRKHYTSDFPSVETVTFSGVDRADAMRKFLTSLEEQGEC